MRVEWVGCRSDVVGCTSSEDDDGEGRLRDRLRVSLRSLELTTRLIRLELFLGVSFDGASMLVAVDTSFKNETRTDSSIRS